MFSSRRRLLQLFGAAPAAMMLVRPGRLRAQAAMAFGARGEPGNVFISPCGKPFRARPGAPYPVADWFRAADANADGRLDKAEFIADAQAFFKVLDHNGDGAISPEEVTYYEQRIAPEVLGMTVVMRGDVIEARPRLILAQSMPGGGGEGGPPTSSEGASRLGSPDSDDDFVHARPYDASGAGASPYSFFDEPEPVAAADIHFRGLIRWADFRDLAEIHFHTLDSAGQGYLTLAGLPKTPVQKRLERASGRRR